MSLPERWIFLFFFGAATAPADFLFGAASALAPAPRPCFQRRKSVFAVENASKEKKTFLVTILHSAKGHRSISSVVGLTHSPFRYDLITVSI